MRRTDLMDTSVEMHKLQGRLMNERGPAWKVRMAIELSEFRISVNPEKARRETMKRVLEKRPQWPN